MRSLVFLIISLLAISCSCAQLPLMPVQPYMFYRRSCEMNGDAGRHEYLLKEYRLPTESEKQSYLYSDYIYDFTKQGGRDDQITIMDIDRLSSWLVKDNAKFNVPFLLKFMNTKNDEFENERARFLAIMEEKKIIVRMTMLSLSALGSDAMTHYMDYLKSDSEVLYENACSGISELFKSKAVQDEMKKRWVRNLVVFLWDNPNAQSRSELVQTLLLLDERDEAPMNIKDWVSICAAETDLTVFERVHYLYPKEFREWEKKEGGFRPLVWGEGVTH